MTDLSIDERLRRLSRTAEMSAGIMRDPERTGGWPGAEKTAMAFDRIKDTVDEIRAALPPVAPAGDDLVCDCQQWPTHVSNECPVHNLFPDPPPEPAAPAGDREAVLLPGTRADRMAQLVRKMRDRTGVGFVKHSDECRALLNEAVELEIAAALDRARAGSEVKS